MKKIIISVVLLGAVSLGSMAFIQTDNDEPRRPRTEVRHGRHAGHGYCHEDCGYRDDNRRYDRRGGCCGGRSGRDYRRSGWCCDGAYDCGACRRERCTVDGCHENGRLCGPCAEWSDRRGRDDVYRRR